MDAIFYGLRLFRLPDFSRTPEQEEAIQKADPFIKFIVRAFCPLCHVFKMASSKISYWYIVCGMRSCFVQVLQPITFGACLLVVSIFISFTLATACRFCRRSGWLDESDPLPPPGYQPPPPRKPKLLIDASGRPRQKAPATLALTAVGAYALLQLSPPEAPLLLQQHQGPTVNGHNDVAHGDANDDGGAHQDMPPSPSGLNVPDSPPADSLAAPDSLEALQLGESARP